ncbi:MAG: hypothetical protein BWZ08_02507 [candidate division BRC1 bacterium ADurb.BinA292]|nr:MAG: hypothetical protein BWZ08_02507 [candidate division BRC1 bacterium ADurb.BinA292]
MEPTAVQPDWFFLIAGIVLGLFGWMLYWAGLPIIGAVVGAGAIGSLGYMASGFVSAAWAPLVFGGAGAVLGAFLGIALIRVLQLYFFFISGAILGAALAYQFTGTTAFQGSSAAAIIIVVVGALVGGFVLLKARRFVVAIVTAAIGAMLVQTGLQSQNPLVLVTSFVIFAAVQIGLVRRYVDQEAFDHRTRNRLRATETPDVRTID